MSAIATDQQSRAEIAGDGLVEPKGTQEPSSIVGMTNFEGDSGLLRKKVRSSAVQNLKYRRNSRSLVQIGDLLVAQRRYSKALQSYMQAYKLNDSSIEITKKIISVNVQQANERELSKFKIRSLNQADLYYRRLLELADGYSPYAYDYLNFMVLYTRDEIYDFDHIEAAIRNYATRYTDNADIFNLAGLFLDRNGVLTNESRTYFEKALKIDSFHIHAINNLGIFHTENGNFKTADTYFLEANEIDPSYIYAYQNRAALYKVQGDNDKAIDILAHAFSVNINLSNLWLGIFSELLIEYKHDYSMAIKVLDRLSESDVDNPRILNNIGVAQQRNGEFKTAIKYYKMAYDILRSQIKHKQPIDSLASTIIKNYITLSHDMGYQQRALHAAELLASHFDSYAQGHVVYARILLELTKYEEVRTQLNKAIELDPLNEEAAVNLSYIYDIVDFDYSASIELLKPHIENAKKSELHDIILNNYTYALIKTGKIKKAELYLPIINDSSFGTITKAVYYLSIDNLQSAEKCLAMYYEKFEGLLENHYRKLNAAFISREMADYYIRNNQTDFAVEYIDKIKKSDIYLPTRLKLLQF